MPAVTMFMTQEQARCVAQALEFYARIGLGQMEILAEQVRLGHIQPNEGLDSIEVAQQVERLSKQIKNVLGHPSNGSYGIGGHRVDISAQRAWEIKKQIEKALAEHRDPYPKFRTVDYDGRILRYTTDPDIQVGVQG